MWGALVGGWGVPAVALAIAMVFSGVSFRFGGMSDKLWSSSEVLTWFRNLPYQPHEQPCGLLDSSSDIWWLDCHYPIHHVWILYKGLFGLSF